MANTKLTAQNLDPNQTTGLSLIDFNPTWYKSDNTTTFTWTTDNVRFIQSGKAVTVQFYVGTASAAPGFNLYMTSPVPVDTTMYNADDTVLGYCKMTGTGFDANSGTPGFVNYNTAAGRIRLNPFTAISMGTSLVISGTFTFFTT